MPAFIQNIYVMAKHRYVKRTFKPYTIKRKIAGIDLILYIADPVGKEWYDVDSTKWPEMDYLKENLLVAGDVVLECGAHHGVTTTFFAKAVGNKGKIIAFEPNPFNISVIRKNVELNNLSNAVVVNKAIGDKAGKANFSYFSNSSLQLGRLGTYPAEITTMDEYLDEKPTMLKIDVEGFDVEALKGAKKVLKTRPKIALEIHTDQLSNYGHKVEDIFSLLDLRGYKCTVMEAGGFHDFTDPKDIKSNVHLFAIPIDK